MKEQLKSPRMVALVRRLGRFRFLLKARQVRAEGVSLREDPANVLRFVLLDPETHSYSFELGNVDELCAFVARCTETSPEQVAAHVEEAMTDPELTTELRKRVRWRIDYKRDLPLGNRLLWYALVRAVKPGLTVETGIYQGLGSLMLLRALARNAEEGSEGRLISIDFDPESGWLVPERLRDRWTPVFGDIESDLEPAINGRDIDLFIHESDHNEVLQRFEFGLALAHAASDLYVIDSSGRELPVLRELCRLHDGEHHVFQERPKNHFYRPVGTAVALFRQVRPRRGAKRFKPDEAVPEREVLQGRDR
jgi:hypothetical protein